MVGVGDFFVCFSSPGSPLSLMFGFDPSEMCETEEQPLANAECILGP